MNQALFELINGWAGSSTLLDAIGLFCAEYLIYAMVFGALGLGLWRYRHAPHYFAVVVLGMGLSWVVANELKMIFDTARPYVELGPAATLLAAPVHDAAFPSGHMAGAVAVATAVWLYFRSWGYLFFAAALAVGFGRMFVGLHWPIDVLGGALIGAVVPMMVYSGSKIVSKRKKVTHGKTRLQ